MTALLVPGASYRQEADTALAKPLTAAQTGLSPKVRARVKARPTKEPIVLDSVIRVTILIVLECFVAAYELPLYV